MSSILSHIKFPLRVRHATGHVFIQDAEGKPRSSVAYAENIPRSYEYAVFICTTLARAMTDLHNGKAPAKVDPPAPPDDLTFKVELWFDDESAVQTTLARTAKVTHAKQLGKRRLFGKEMIWEIPICIGMALIGDSLAVYLELSRPVSVGLIAALAYLGPRGAESRS